MLLSAETIGKELADANGEDSSEWSPDDFADYLFDVGDWVEVFRVAWRGGSAAGIQEYLGVFYAYDDAERYGPYDSFAEARQHLQVTEDFDKIVDRWVDSRFVQEDHDSSSP